MLVFVGSISGMLIFSTFTEKLGRKRSLALSLSILIVGLTLTLAGGYLKSIPLVIVAILLTYGGCENGYQYVNCFCTEVIAEEWRITYFNALNVINGLGSVITGFAFFYIKQWDIVYLYVFLIPAVLTFSAVTFFV
jgi:MFS family permease